MATEETLIELHKAADAISAIKYLPYQWNVVHQRFDPSPPARQLRWAIYFTCANIYVASKVLTFLFQIPKTADGKIDIAKLIREFIAIFGILLIAMVYLINGYFYHEQSTSTFNMLLNLNQRLKIRSRRKYRNGRLSRFIYYSLNKGWPGLYVGSIISTFYNMPNNVLFDLFHGNVACKVLFWAFELQFLHSVVFLCRFNAVLIMIQLNCYRNWLNAIKGPLLRRKKDTLLERVSKYQQIYKTILLLYCRQMQSISNVAATGGFFVCSLILVMSYFIVIRFHTTSSLTRLVMPTHLIFMVTLTFPVAIAKAYVTTKLSTAIIHLFKLNVNTPQDKRIVLSLFPFKTHVGSFFVINRGTALNLLQSIFRYVMKLLLWY